MIVKIMSNDGLPDGDPHKQFSLIADAIGFTCWYQDEDPVGLCDVSHPSGWYIRVERLGWPAPFHPILITGNVYFLDEYGKTFDRFIIDPPRPPQPV